MVVRGGKLPPPASVYMERIQRTPPIFGRSLNAGQAETKVAFLKGKQHKLEQIAFYVSKNEKRKTLWTPQSEWMVMKCACSEHLETNLLNPDDEIA